MQKHKPSSPVKFFKRIPRKVYDSLGIFMMLLFFDLMFCQKVPLPGMHGCRKKFLPIIHTSTEWETEEECPSPYRWFDREQLK